KPPRVNPSLFKISREIGHGATVLAEQATFGALGAAVTRLAASAFKWMESAADKLREKGMSESDVKDFENSFETSSFAEDTEEVVTALASKFNRLSVSRRKHALKAFDQGYWPLFEDIPPSTSFLFE